MQSAIVCCHNDLFFETEHYGHKILMLWNSWKQVPKVNQFLNAKTTATRFSAKEKAGCTNASHDFNLSF